MTFPSLFDNAPARKPTFSEKVESFTWTVLNPLEALAKAALYVAGAWAALEFARATAFSTAVSKFMLQMQLGNFAVPGAM